MVFSESEKDTLEADAEGVDIDGDTFLEPGMDQASEKARDGRFMLYWTTAEIPTRFSENFKALSLSCMAFEAALVLGRMIVTVSSRSL